MNKRKRVLIIMACFVALAALWNFFLVSVLRTDDARYERWKHTERLAGRVIWWERRLPGSFNYFFRLQAREQNYWDERERLREALLSSGYLTNFPIEVAMAPTNYVQRAELADRLRNVFQGRNEWEFGVRSNAVIFTCRPQDVSLCRQAIRPL